RPGRDGSVLRPGDLVLRSALARRLCQILFRAPRFSGRADSGGKNITTTRREKAPAAVPIPRFLPARQSGRLCLSYRRRGNVGLAVGRRWYVHPACWAGQRPPIGRIDEGGSAAMAASARNSRQAGK